jgi:hypothetical protein
VARRSRKICCDECGVEITWTPVVIANRRYCCQDCAVGLECDCDRTGAPGDGEEEAEFPWRAGVEDGVEFTFGPD